RKRTEVDRASPKQHVPHINWPHSDPMMREKKVNAAPSSAAVVIATSYRRGHLTRVPIAEKAIVIQPYVWSDERATREYLIIGGGDTADQHRDGERQDEDRHQHPAAATRHRQRGPDGT